LNKMGYSGYKVNTNSNANSSTPKTSDAVSFLYDREGKRKYLTVSERAAFLDATRKISAKARTFCLVLAYTGARLSEVLALTPERIDFAGGLVIIESLKKRRRGVFRAVPIPAHLLEELDRAHGIRKARHLSLTAKERLWRWCRTTAWNRVKQCMATAGVSGSQASPKGLRHAFAIGALQAGVPINMVKKWMGHARLSTTEIYADAIGVEEQLIASRFWGTF
jgi:integrase/recombinase XerD